MCSQVFAPVPIEAEACGAGALCVIQDCGARLFDRRLGKVARVGEPKLQRGAAHRFFAGR
jgi:hypothetical protein